MDPKAAAKRILQKLDELGWSRRELGRRAGYGEGSNTSSRIGTMLKGVTPQADFISQIAATLGVSVDWIMHGDESPENPAIDQSHGAASGTGAVSHGKSYSARKAAARKLAPEIPAWVWDDLDTTDMLFLGTNEPSVAALIDLARVIFMHGTARD